MIATKHGANHRKEHVMKKGVVLFVALVLFTAVSGCDAIKEATQIEFNIMYNYVFAVDANLATRSYDVVLEASPDYAKYKGRIKEINIEYLRYAITSNTGNGGKAAFYVNAGGNGLDTAKKVAETITFAAGETRGVTDVVWLDKGYIQSLLPTGHLSVWSVAEGAGVRLTVPAELMIKVTTNPLE